MNRLPIVAASVVAFGLLDACSRVQAGDASAIQRAETYWQGQPLRPFSATTVIAEAEEFQPADKNGWQARPFGTNYYAATFANAFLSRKAYLGAPAQCKESRAALEVEVPAAGKYLVLVRYEACYRFETEFQVQVEQNGKQVFKRLYGSRDNLRIWPFRQMLKKEVAWSWGAAENVVWEGHDAFVSLQPGRARITLVAGKQPEPAARRNVDLVMLTSDIEQVQMRINKENYLPLDGMLTQAGDVYLKMHVAPGSSDVTLNVPNGTEHSPYWVHLRKWPKRQLQAKPGMSTDWVEVGSLLDTLADGQWKLNAQGKNPRFDLEFGVKDGKGNIQSIRRFKDLTGNAELAYEADMRYSRRIRLADEVLYDLVAYLKKQPIRGKALTRTLVYGYTFVPKPDNAKYTQARDEFLKLIGATALSGGGIEKIDDRGKLITGYIDVRSVPTSKLEAYCQKLVQENKAKNIAVVSLGDEIGLAKPRLKDQSEFHTFLKSKKLSPNDIDSSLTAWDQVKYSPSAETAKSNPGLYYYSQLFGFRYGIAQLKERTDILKRYLPNARIGANFSPHHKHMYLGDTHHWISVFREQGMTMPWGEDYIWQVQVGTQQMNFIMLDMYRAGIEGKKDAKIHYYVMPHTPGNTTASWRRQFYGDLAHGAKILNLFEFRPVQAAYTENHCSDPAMFQEVRKSLHELGTFEDIIQDGHVRPAQAGLWCSEAADVWDDHKAPFDSAKRTLYVAIRQSEVPLDFVVDGDKLARFKVIYLADAHVSQSGTRDLIAWVQQGGILYATAGAGMFDERNQPNLPLQKLLGVTQQELQNAPGPEITFEKQDLPFAEPVATVVLQDSKQGKMPVFGLRSKVQLKGAQQLASFDDKLPAVTVNTMGKGRAHYLAFLPGLSYFKPALPKLPLDRGTTDDTYSHLVPTAFDERARQFIDPGKYLQVPVHCSSPRIATSVIQAKEGMVIPLINWNPDPVKGLTVTLRLDVPHNNVTAASGRPVAMKREGATTSFTLDLEVADALILR